MGVDCKLMINDVAFHLDRWYCFGDMFSSGKVYSKEVALCMLKNADMEEIDPINSYDREYIQSWIDIAVNIIRRCGGDCKIRFFSDGHYYETVDNE